MSVRTHDVVVVGSGFGGLAMTHRLRERGIRDVVMIERADAVGGTWRDNHYPGAACDVPSHLYSLSFAPNPDWRHSFSRQPQIRDYLERVADDFDLRRSIRFGTELLSATWRDDIAEWHLETSTGPLWCRTLVSAAGALSDPVTPDVEGLADFDGPVFHSARWDHDVDLSGRRVAVIGTGASAIQFVPEIQPIVDRLTVMQRTPPWVMPRRDRATTAAERRFYRRVPLAQKAVRGAIYLGRETTISTFTRPRLGRAASSIALAHLRRQVTDPELRRRLRPDYAIGCKRILLSNDYYPALTADNAEVVGGLDRVDGNTVVDASGARREVDVIIFGTGFSVQQPVITERIVGLDGVRLSERAMTTDGALVGASFSGFPNFFLLLGPNTGLGHTSQVFMIERQVDYVAELLAGARRQGARRIEVDAARQRAWTARVDERMASTVWTTGGCRSWYLDDNGRNTTLWPGSTLSFLRSSRRAGLDDYRLSRG